MCVLTAGKWVHEMLERIDLESRMDKKEYQARKDELVNKLVVLQQECVREKLPVVICIDGWGASGKGTTISKVAKELDPRTFRVYSMAPPTDLDRRYPFIARYWQRIGQYGTITIFDKSWYSEAISTYLDAVGYEHGKIMIPHPAIRNSAEYVEGSHNLRLYAESARMFEQQIVDDGYLLIKCFFHVSKDEQRRRLEGLCADRSTAWRVNERDLRQNMCYDQYYETIDALLSLTDGVEDKMGTWHIIASDSARDRTIAFMEALASEMEAALERRRERALNHVEIPDDEPLPPSKYTLVDVQDVESLSHDLTLEDKEYRKQLKIEQDRLSVLQSKLYHRGIPMMLVYEGWDAAGKGGNIKRVAAALDARDYRVVPSAKPTVVEKEHPFMWRYWMNLPKSGHTAIYDRSWYGRVMVERVEGFCTSQDWRRAYEEMNDFEWEMHRSGAIVLKFWINISNEEQLRRFEARLADPSKAWKMTDEDWRNRDKYAQYLVAINDMLKMTSTDFAPWHLIESDDKKYARIKALKIINEAIEARLGG